MAIDRSILFLPAVEQARRLRRDELSSVALVNGYLAAIEALDPKLCAFVELLVESALREARAADTFRGKQRPPFLGVPIGIKDLNPVRGSFTRLGSRAFEKLYSPLDCRTTARLREAGFVMLGKTSTSEVGALPVTEPRIHPPTRNPWDLGVTPGGSSGGAGAAVAAGLIPIAQGSDAGGSIRIPASCCGLVGFKPSRGRVENSYGLDDKDVLYTSGPIARTVDDAAAMFDVMAGITVGSPHWAPPPEAPFAELARRPPSGLRIAFATSTPLVETHPDVAAAVVRVAKLAASLGHHVEERPVFAGTVDDFLPIYRWNIGKSPVFDWSLVEPVTRWLGEAGRSIPDADALRMQNALAERVLAWFAPADVWITPTIAIAPPAIGAFADLPPDVAFGRASQMGLFTALFNATGQPAASLPAGLSRTGVPIGVQIVGRPLADATVLALSRQIEEAAPFVARPPLVA